MRKIFLFLIQSLLFSSLIFPMKKKFKPMKSEINNKLTTVCKEENLLEAQANKKNAHINWRYKLVICDPCHITKIELYFDNDRQKFNSTANVIGFFKKEGEYFPIIIKQEKKRLFGVCKESSKKILDLDFFLCIAKYYNTIRKEKFDTSLHEGISSGNPCLINYILEKAVEVKNDCSQHYPKIYVYKNNLISNDFGQEEFSFSTERDCKKNKIIWFNPLHQAVKKGDMAIIKFLLGKRIDLDSKDEYGRTPLDLAIQNNKTQIVKFLLAKGAKIIF